MHCLYPRNAATLGTRAREKGTINGEKYLVVMLLPRLQPYPVCISSISIRFANSNAPGGCFHLPFSPPPAGPAWAGGRHLAASFHSQGVSLLCCLRSPSPGVSLLCCLRFPRSSLSCWWVHTPGRAQEPVPEAARDPEAGREVPWGWRGAQ